MGFIKAFSGAFNSTLADQWKDFYTPRSGVPATAAVFQAVPQSQNNGRGENYKGNENIITNGSKIIVPEGTALITLQDGQITGFIAEPGGFEFKSDDINSQSIFAGDGLLAPTIKSSWEKVKFGGQPGSQQLAFYINLKEIPGLKFGTQSTVYWNDSYLDLKAGGMANGTYSIKINDPLLFIKNFVPIKYLEPNAPIFDFADMENEAADQLFKEFVGSLSGALSRFSQEAKMVGIDTMDYIQGNSSKFAQAMGTEVENFYHWSTNRGIIIINTNVAINYDEKTQEVLDSIRKDDAEIRKAKRMGEAYNANPNGMMASAVGQSMQTASGNENGAMMGFFGMNAAQQMGTSMMGTFGQAQQVQQPMQQQSMEQQPMEQQVSQPQQDPMTVLTEKKKLLDAGLITQEDYDALKAKILGL